MASILAPILFFIIMIGALFLIPKFMIRRAIRQVVAIFRHYGAMSPDRAKTQIEMGLNPPDFMTRITSLRDYKPHAVQILMTNGVVVSTEDGKLYINEQKLSELSAKMKIEL